MGIQKASSGKRLFYIDNIRWVMIVLVVLMHLKVTYSNMGMWYYNEAVTLDAVSYVIFGMYGSFVQAFFMGLLFFVAGYFVPASLDRKGNGKFVSDRFVRLGIPTLVFMLLLNPLTFLMTPASTQISASIMSEYAGYITSLSFLGGSGPMWFALALLIFSVAYVAVRQFTSRNKTAVKAKDSFLVSNKNIVILIALISLFTFLSRLFYPSGTAVLNMQLGNFSQYIILFIAGILAYRYDLLSKISYNFGMLWLKLALFIGIPTWFLLMILGGALTGSTAFNGGLYWQAAAYSVWESFFCVGISLGLLVLFRRKYDVQGKISAFLSKNAFGVYVFHAPILVAITLMFQGVVMYPLLKMILMAFIVIPVCFGFVYLLRKIPLMERLFS